MRLHKESRFDENEVIIKRVGPVPRLFPSHYRADDLFTLLDEIGPLEIERHPSPEPRRDLDLD